MEILDGKVISRFNKLSDDEIDSITLFNGIRGIYVKLTATNSQYAYSPSKKFKIFNYGKWVITDNNNKMTGKKFFRFTVKIA